MTPVSPRLPRYRRVSHPPPFCLTARDRAVIRWVHHCRYLTSRQIRRLPSLDESTSVLFPPATKSNVDKRLRLLFQHGYLWRIAMPTAAGSGPAVYCLDARGRDLVASELQTEPREIHWRRAIDIHKDLIFLEHTLAINDFRLDLENAAIGQRCQVLEWREERTLRGNHTSGFAMGIRAESGSSVYPDAYFVLQLPDGRTARHFLELDRGRQEQRAIRRKVSGYMEYVSSGRYQQQYQARSLRVIVVTTAGERRLLDLKRWTEAENGTNLFWLTTAEQTQPRLALSEPVWCVAGRPGTFRLVG